jgi:hypothetical protein
MGSRRRRLAITGATAAAIAALAVVGALLIAAGPSDLARAADRMSAQNMFGRLRLEMSTTDGHFAISGTTRETADGSRGISVGTVRQGSRELPLSTLVIDGRVWVRFPGAPRLMPPGKRWVHMVDDAVAPRTLTPAQFAHFLADADDVHEVADDERVLGRLTTHYRGLLDLEDVAGEVGGTTAERYRRRFGDRDLRVPIEAWISRDGLPRRLTLRMHAGGESFDSSIDIVRYGVPVHVRRPPAARVIEQRDWIAYTKQLEPS